jgi:hypothetical protein
MAFLVNGTAVVDNSRNLTNIVGTDSATTTALALELVSENSVAAGSTARVRGNFETAKTSAGYIVTFGPINVAQRGVITFATNVRISNASGPGTFAMNRRRNGAEVTVWAQTITTTTNTAYTNNQSVLPGDQYLFYLEGGSYVSGKSTIQTTAYASNQELRTSVGSVWLPVGVNSWYHLY